MNDSAHSDGATSQPLGIVAPFDHEIRSALAALPAGDFAAAASDLLAALGYRSKRTLELSGDVDDFSAQFPAANPDTATERVFRDNAQSARLLFQLTDSEIEVAAPASLFNAGGFDSGNARSFLFVAIELRGATYPRGQYAAFTREINKRLNQPTVILFRSVADLLTLAFIHRRPNRRAPDRAVLGSVSLIREIDPASPQRAHLDILAELALADRLRWLDARGARHNFDGLLAAWLDALDTEELNRRFYKDLFAWFTRALSEATFPANEARTLPAEEYVIRLITRLLFVWFIRELDGATSQPLGIVAPFNRGLIAADLFIEARVEKLLQDYDRDSGDSYYRAVLQNLFFATLNTDIDQRRFARKTNADHRNFSLYRYREEIADPDALLALFAQTPFINGGLFDCLDSEEAPKQGGYRLDCFSDNVTLHRGRPQGASLRIPNRLFFDDDGLIPLFKRYKFTVEENTPAEREVALDPELLGKVFENLLAAYNPETRATARKQTGSYYTPRPVVDYMVDEALVAALAEKAQPADGDADSWRERLRYLLDYEDAFNDAHELFAESEKESLARAIAGLKILDPAVGSGAFPMGALHKLTLALRRLDPDNRRWEQLQKELALDRAASAFDTQDQRDRDTELQEISDTFEKYRDSDFGRKLYLIQNSVYGVDIQTIATQIAKLRFFISLAIEQEPDRNAANYGIKPLPNLETRFVAANTLLALGWTHRGQMSLGQTDAVNALQRELNANRERHFHAATRRKKLACREHDRQLRDRLAAALTQSGMPIDDAEKIARWDPYDQNASADWFDAEYMFGVADGFDVVIGNPPYVNVENLSAEMRNYLLNRYQTCERRTDIYIAFLEKSLSVLNGKGMVCFIIPAAFTKQRYATKMRQKLVQKHTLQALVDASSYRIFENAVVRNAVLTVAKERKNVPTRIRLHHSNADFENRSGTEFLVDQTFFTSLKDCRLDTNPAMADAIKIKEKIWRNAMRFDRICLVAYGARLNHRSAKIGKSRYLSPSPVAGGKKFCEGRNIARYSFLQDGWLTYTPDEHYNPMFPQLFENEKLMFINVVKDKLRCAYDGEGFYNSHTVINCVRLDLLAITGASHTTATRALKSADIAIAGQFDYKFLLAVLNSQVTNWYFLNFLSESLHFYPNDAKSLPIPRITAVEQRPFIRLVERILSAKDAAPGADTGELEAEIDRLVYALYGLTAEEIAAVETV